MRTDQLPHIPDAFLHSETGQPFSECLMCKAGLSSQRMPYVIEKSFRRYPSMGLSTVAFEFAICGPCMMEAEAQLSAHTRLALAGFFQEHLHQGSRPDWAPGQPFIEEEWIGRCAITGQHREEMTEYSICARCIDGRIIPDMAPYLLSGQAQERIAGLLSAESQGFFDDFTDTYFSGPPELRELFKGRPVLV